MKYIYILIISTFLFSACSDSKEELNQASNSQLKPVIKASKKWLGKWDRDIWQNYASLEISKIEDDKIHFILLAGSGGHTGEVEGIATVKGNKATFKESYEADECLITFQLNKKSIEIKQIKGTCFAAMGVFYDGTFINEKFAPKEKEMNLVNLEVLNDKEDLVFRELVENKYKDFVNSTQLTSECKDIDSLNSIVTCSGVRGMFTYMENIIMIDPNQKIWAAVIDDNQVYYFTNDEKFKDKLPKTIEAWRENFKEYKVIY